MTVRIHVGDVREQLRAMPDAYFDSVVTSPPYWGLRDYEAHFATFPPALAERCIKAGVPAQACGLCGAALPHPRCEGLCRFSDPVPVRVLDPFGGAGTVGLVAAGLGLDATLIELNPEYAAMSARRIGAAAVIVGAPAPLPMAAE